MLKGHFENCYGLESFDLDPIPFSPTMTKAIIYAPNGVMKSSFAKVLDNISRKKRTEDRIFTERKTTFKVEYYDDVYTESYKKEVPTIYVINSFDAAFESFNDSVTTILADDELKQEYALVMKSFSEKLKPLIDSFFRHCSPGIPIQESVSESFCNSRDADWDTILKQIEDYLGSEATSELLASIRFDEIFNPQVYKVISSAGFAEKINKYITIIDSLIQNSKIFNNQFDDRNARDFGDSIAKTKLFDANHKILMSSGSIITNIDEWNNIIDSEMCRINDDPIIKSIYADIDKALNANIATRKLKEIIKANRIMLAHFDNLELLRKKLWISYAVTDSVDIIGTIAALKAKETEIEKLNMRAAAQYEHWRKVVELFRTRFRVPFDVTIQNGSLVALRGEPARLGFSYQRNGESREKSKEELMNYLSVGEKRALYLLQILFDLEKVKISTCKLNKRHLIIVDDIADSFDYTNKYAIVEYLDELASNNKIDILILTHNFDFYRTISSRLGIGHDMCFVAQRNANGNLKMGRFTYRNDYFTKGILERIRNGEINDDPSLLKLVIASIPFCRNLAEYLGTEQTVNDLTALLHIKANTEKKTLKDYWDIIQKKFIIEDLICPQYERKLMIDIIFEIADKLVLENSMEVSLEDKLVMAIAIRLKSELFLKDVLLSNNQELECKKNQTREWIKRAKSNISAEKYDIINKVGLITPESIHVNAFMYEPLIDIPNWQLIELYTKTKDL